MPAAILDPGLEPPSHCPLPTVTACNPSHALGSRQRREKRVQCLLSHCDGTRGGKRDKAAARKVSPLVWLTSVALRDNHSHTHYTPLLNKPNGVFG